MASISLPVFINIACWLVVFTISLCYGLAVGLGHVPAWLPFISDCAVESPEKYPFRVGVVVGAFLLAVEIVAIYNADRKFSKDRLCLYAGVMSTVCLATVGVVNEKENGAVHGASAVSFFVLSALYTTVMAWNSTLDPDIGRLSLSVKQICALYGILALIVAGLCALDYKEYKLFIAICEWTGVFDILLFHLTFALDVTYLSFKEDSSKTTMQKDHQTKPSDCPA